MLCPSGPWDDRSQPRVDAEAKAVLLLFDAIRSGALEWSASEVLAEEIGRIADLSKRAQIETGRPAAARAAVWDSSVEQRADALQIAGLKRMDSLHVASAESVGANYFVTCDDRLLRVLNRDTHLAAVGCYNPVDLVRELSK